jgi:hypothetical protein
MLRCLSANLNTQGAYWVSRRFSKVLTKSPRPDQDRHLKILARRIARQLEVETQEVGHCGIYEDELQRIWPLDEENRKEKIGQFAKEYGFKLSFYKKGLCAIFEKESPRKSQ